MQKLSKYLYEKTDKKVLLTVSIIFVLFVIIVMPIVSRYTEDVTNNADSPDLSLLYKADDLYKMADDYGEQGRNAYVVLRFTFDLVFPILYLSFLIISTTFLINKLGLREKLGCLNLFAFLAVFFDLAENLSAAIVIGRYPKESNIIAHIAPYATLIKWVFVSASFAIVVVLAILTIIKKIKKA